jgi:hypothetical protein
MAVDCVAPQHHRRSHEAIHEEAVRWFHLGLEGERAHRAQPLALLDHRPLGAEVDGVHGGALQPRQRPLCVTDAPDPGHIPIKLHFDRLSSSNRRPSTIEQEYPHAHLPIFCFLFRHFSRRWMFVGGPEFR